MDRPQVLPRPPINYLRERRRRAELQKHIPATLTYE
jgi:hypothetical protein